MENGRARKISAKELTEQINQATDLGLAVGAEGQSFGEPMPVGPAPVARERAQQLGWQVLDGGKNELISNAERVATEIADFEATQEIVRDEMELEHPEEFVGDETPLQIKERLQNQQENSLNEIDPRRDAEAETVARSQEKIAQTAMGEVESLLKEKQVFPGKIVEIWRKRGDAVLNSYENPHPIGKGN